ncbi:MAG: EAL domain-containing protein [Methyloprofundus sp.]|nr:EAL domain-containing protein [Methyloprofundus sp.]
MEPQVISLSSEYSVTTEQAGKLLKLQRGILEQVALGVDYREILDALCKVAEEMVSDSLASIMIYDETGSFLTVLAAPSIPAEAVGALNGLVPSENAGSCGTAVHSNEPQYVVDTRTDHRWCDLQTFVDSFAIGACWSCPIKLEEGRAVGSFALSSFEKRTPSAFYKQLLETSAHIVGIILKLQQEEQLLRNLARYDVLTGLANRTLFNNKLSQALKRAEPQHSQLAVLILGLDGFRDINDTQGHDLGDRVLKWVAEKVQSELAETDFFARLGGDEFVILIEYLDEPLVIERLIRKIHAVFKQKIEVANLEFSLSTSIGVSFFPEDGQSAQELLRNAGTALHEAKESGRNCARIYNEKLTDIVRHRVDLVADMRTALINGDFILHYQPQFCQKSNKLLATEVLVRWQHAEKGLIPPDDFIPLAEQSGLINDLGLWIFTTACQQCKDWWDSGMPEFSLAINLSVKQLDAENIQKFKDILLGMEFPVHNLEVEVTEGLIMRQESLQELKKLEDFGVRISMDDFGTGHSSLAQLKHLPISKLKIDRSFIKDLETNENDKVIVKTIIAMGHSLGLKIVAEGVETVEQQGYLVKQGCDLIQGYLLSRPVPPEQLEALLVQV